MPIDTVAGLVDAIRAHRLLEHSQVSELTSMQSRFTDSRLLARELLQRGWLTAYQINQLAQGHAGNLVLGQYLLLERIGEGGMGQVFKARHLRLQRIAAVKVIRPERLSSPDVIQRFQREALAAAKLSHPNIVTVYDADEVNGTHFFAMEYVEGTDLAHLVKQKGPLEIRQACDYTRQAAMGLQHAHEKGLVHRDIKPHNLLVTPLGVVKILDMGLARLHAPLTQTDSATEALTREGAVMGTPDYIAPEQAVASHQVDIRADLYSLGCTLYFLLSGRPPFVGGSLAQKLLWHQGQEPPRIEDLRREVPAGLASVVRTMMAKHPAQRYLKPADVASALAAFCLGMIPLAQPISASAAPEAKPAASDTVMVGSAPGAIPVATHQETMATGTTGEHLRAPVRRGWPSQRRVAMAGGALIGIVLVVLLLRGGNGAGRDNANPDDPGWPLDNLEPAAFNEVREFDWPPKGLVMVLGSHRGRHWGPVRAVAWSPDGKLIASGGDDSQICVWKADTLEEYRLFRGHTGSIRSLVFSPDSERLLSGGDDKTVRLWDIAERKELLKLEGHGDPVTCLAFSKDGSRAFSGGGGNIDCSVRVWDIAGEGKEVAQFKGHTAGVRSLTVLSDGRRAQSGDANNTVWSWNLDGTNGVRHVEPPAEGARPVVALSRDSRWAVTAHFGGAGFVLWNTTSKAPRYLGSTFNEYPLSAAFSTDGRRFVGACRYLEIFDVQSGTPLRNFDAGSNVWSVAFSADGRRLASGGEDGLVRLWDMESGKEILPRPGHGFAVHSVALSKDGRYVLTGGADKTVRLWDLTSDPPGREVRSFEGHQNIVSKLLFSPDGSRALSGDGNRTCLWDMKTSKELHRLDGAVSTLAFSETGAPLVISPASPAVGLDLGRRDVITGKVSRRVQVLTTAGDYLTAAYLPKTDMIAGGHGFNPSPGVGDVLLWDAGNSAKERAHVTCPTACCMSFSADGGYLIWGCNDGSVRKWDVASAATKPPATLAGLSKSVTGVAISPDNTRIAASAIDGRVIVWDAATGERWQDWRLPGPVHGVAFDEKTHHLATANANGTVFILRLRQPTVEPK